MNTGTGKTLVGLLALQSSINEGFGPALYVCPDNYLVAQVTGQAKQFGVRCLTVGPDGQILSEFLNGEAILVTNVKKLFKGLTVFGVRGGKHAPVPLGAVVVDDAHACVEQIRSQFSVVLPSDHPAYGKLLSLFRESLSQQRPGTFADIEAGDYARVMAVPYWTWHDIQPAIVSILSEHREDESLVFAWPLLRDMLAVCDCLVSGTQMQIVSRLTRVEEIPSFAEAKRRIFLSATLLDDSQLARDLGVSVEDIRAQIKPNEFDDLGERLIVIPSDAGRHVDTNFAITVLREGAKKLNRVAIVPTKRDGGRWEAAGAQPVLAANIQEAREPLRSSKGRFLVLISKSDGVDLPDDACRLLVLDGLPRAASPMDRHLQSVLPGTRTTNARIAQKVEQGLGRATRGKSDWCVVLITGNDLVAFIRNRHNRRHFSPGVNAQLDLGLAITGELRNTSAEEQIPNAIIGEINRCIRREEEWKAFYRSYIEAARERAREPAEDSVALDTATKERSAATLFLQKSYRHAEACIREIVETPDITPREKGGS